MTVIKTVQSRSFSKWQLTKNLYRINIAWDEFIFMEFSYTQITRVHVNVCSSAASSILLVYSLQEQARNHVENWMELGYNFPDSLSESTLMCHESACSYRPYYTGEKLPQAFSQPPSRGKFFWSRLLQVSHMIWKLKKKKWGILKQQKLFPCGYYGVAEIWTGISWWGWDRVEK